MKNVFQCIVIMMTVLFSITFATDRTVPITFSVTSSGINRFLAGQWNAAGFQKLWSNSNYNGLSYSIVINRPVISLATGNIKITLSLTIHATEGTTTIFDGTAAVTPTLTIPTTTISMDKIYSQYTDLHSAVLAVIPDSRLQQKVEEALSPISWIMYQGKVMNESTSRFTESADIGWKGLPTITFAVANDEVNLTVTPTVYSNAPSYSFQWRRTDNRTFGFRVYSNNQFTLDLTNNYLTITSGGGVGYAVSSTLPATATYDVTQQKYAAEVSFYLNNAVVWGLGSVYSKLKIKRANMETLWTFNFITLGTSDWTFSNTQITAIHGE